MFVSRLFILIRNADASYDGVSDGHECDATLRSESEVADRMNGREERRRHRLEQRQARRMPGTRPMGFRRAESGAPHDCADGCYQLVGA